HDVRDLRFQIPRELRGLVKTVDLLVQGIRGVVHSERAVVNDDASERQLVIAIYDNEAGTLRKRHTGAVTSAIRKLDSREGDSLSGSRIHFQISEKVRAIHPERRRAVGRTRAAP